jgi:hypothetical protein
MSDTGYLDWPFFAPRHGWRASSTPGRMKT